MLTRALLTLLLAIAMGASNGRPIDAAASGHVISRHVMPNKMKHLAQPAEILRYAQNDRREVAEYLIHFKPDRSSASTIDRFMTAHHLIALKRLPRVDVWLVAPSDPSHPIDAHALAAEDAVAWIELNGTVYASGVVPNDPFYDSQQRPYLELMGLPQAWSWTTGDTPPIAFVDTGVDLDHPDLVDNLWTNTGEIPANGLDDDGNDYIDDVNGWNFVAASNNPQDDAGHGSHVAGIAAARGNNGLGIAGMAWRARIMPLKALRSNGSGSWAAVAEAIIYAADNGARIINLSLGGSDSSQTIEAAVNYARNHGCLLIAAAGNGGLAVDYPARSAGVLAVAATDNDDVRWLNSNYGPEVDVAAPGVGILSTSRTGWYFFLDGTSMSTAHVSGLAALIWSMRPALSADEVADVITSTAHDVAFPGWDQLTGWGRIDAVQAVSSVARWYLPIMLVR
jgi:subtilisin family serine protease